mmetsp:Transcript_36055/g.107914  ORF Transcript_36055/g.107914 Transcript_36055/m.107914 type:complete len:293 (-) Transcript_36055:1029-1907(-)
MLYTKTTKGAARALLGVAVGDPRCLTLITTQADPSCSGCGSTEMQLTATRRGGLEGASAARPSPAALSAGEMTQSAEPSPPPPGAAIVGMPPRASERLGRRCWHRIEMLLLCGGPSAKSTRPSAEPEARETTVPMEPLMCACVSRPWTSIRAPPTSWRREGEAPPSPQLCGAPRVQSRASVRSGRPPTRIASVSCSAHACSSARSPNESTASSASGERKVSCPPSTRTTAPPCSVPAVALACGVRCARSWGSTHRSQAETAAGRMPSSDWMRPLLRSSSQTSSKAGPGVRGR